MQKLGKKQLTIELSEKIASIPAELESFKLELAEEGSHLTYTYDTRAERTGITALLSGLGQSGIKFRDLVTTQSSLEDIFVTLVKEAE